VRRSARRNTASPTENRDKDLGGVDTFCSEAGDSHMTKPGACRSWFFGVSLTVWLVVASALSTDAAQTAPPTEAFKKAVADCVTEIRRKYPNSDFNAYVAPDGQINAFSDDQERSAFLKCMDEKGYVPKKK